MHTSLFVPSSTQAKCPEDYRQWLVSMYSLFGSKWAKLHCGPMWRVESTAQQDNATAVTKVKLINVHIVFCMFTNNMHVEI